MRPLIRHPAAIVWAAALCALLPSIPPGPAAAHAIILESEPAAGAALAEPPARLYLRFNSKLEKHLSRLTLAKGKGIAAPLPIPPDGRQPPDRIVVPLDPLAPGAYVVRYKVLAVDGHVTEGALRFSVRGPK